MVYIEPLAYLARCEHLHDDEFSTNFVLVRRCIHDLCRNADRDVFRLHGEVVVMKQQ